MCASCAKILKLSHKMGSACHNYHINTCTSVGNYVSKCRPSAPIWTISALCVCGASLCEHRLQPLGRWGDTRETGHSISISWKPEHVSLLVWVTHAKYNVLTKGIYNVCPSPTTHPDPHQYGWAAVARVSDTEAGFGRDMRGFSQLRLQNVGQRARDTLPLPLWRALRNSNTEGPVSCLCLRVSGVFICWCTKHLVPLWLASSPIPAEDLISTNDGNDPTNIRSSIDGIYSSDIGQTAPIHVSNSYSVP